MNKRFQLRQEQRTSKLRNVCPKVHLSGSIGVVFTGMLILLMTCFVRVPGALAEEQAFLESFDGNSLDLSKWSISDTRTYQETGSSVAVSDKLIITRGPSNNNNGWLGVASIQDFSSYVDDVSYEVDFSVDNIANWQDNPLAFQTPLGLWGFHNLSKGYLIYRGKTGVDVVRQWDQGGIPALSQLVPDRLYKFKIETRNGNLRFLFDQSDGQGYVLAFETTEYSAPYASSSIQGHPIYLGNADRGASIYDNVRVVKASPAVPSDTYMYYLPFLGSGSVSAMNDNLITGIAFANASEKEVSIKATAYSSSGSLLTGTTNPATFNLKAREQKAILDFQLFGWSQAAPRFGWVSIESSSEIGLMSLLLDSDFSRSMDGAPAASFVRNQLYFMLSYSGDQPEYRSYFSICNPNSQAATISISSRNPAGEVVEAKEEVIPPNGNYLYIGPASIPSGYLIVNSDLPVTGSQIYRNARDSASLGAAVEGNRNSYVFPHFAVGGGYTTNIGLVNPHPQTVRITFTGRREDGTVLVDGVTRDLQGGQSLYESVAVLLGISSDLIATGYITAQSDQPGIMGFTDFVYGDRMASAATPIQTAPALTLTFSHLAHQIPATNGKSWATGIALLNPSTTYSATVTLDARQSDGTLAGRTTFSLHPGEKIAKLLSYPEPYPGIFSGNMPIGGGQVEVRSTIPLYGFELLFTDDVSQIVSVPAQILLSSTDRQIKLTAPPNHKPEEYEILTDTNPITVDSEGFFRASVPQNEIGSIISSLKNDPSSVGYAAVTIGAEQVPELSAQTTAEYLVFYSPLIGTKDIQQAAFILQAIKGDTKVAGLATVIENAFKTSSLPYYEDPTVVAALDDALLSIIQSGSAAMLESASKPQPVTSLVQSGSRNMAVFPLRSSGFAKQYEGQGTNDIQSDLFNQKFFDLYNMAVEPISYINSRQHAIKLRLVGMGSGDLGLGSGAHYIAAISQLDPADFPNGFADLNRYNRRSTFDLLPEGEGFRAHEILASSNIFEVIDLLGFGLDRIFGQVADSQGVPIDTKPGIYLVRASSGSFDLFYADGDNEIGFINSALTQKEPFNASIRIEALEDNAVLLLFDAIGLAIDLKGLIDDRALVVALKTESAFLKEFSTDSAWDASRASYFDKLLPAVVKTIEYGIEETIKYYLKNPKAYRQLLLSKQLTRSSIRAFSVFAKNIAGSLELLSKASKVGQMAFRLADLMRLPALESAIVVVGDPFSTGTKPLITGQPAGKSIASGQTATLSVSASGTAPLSYQWYTGQSGDTGNPIPYGVNSSYTTPSLTNTTNYWVRVTNTYGSADSITATITVVSYRSLTVQSDPGAVTVTVAPADINGNSNGGTPFARSYVTGTQVKLTVPGLFSGKSFHHWERDGASIGTSTSIDFAMDADHTLKAVYSATIGSAPTIVSQPPNQTVGIGNPATLSITASGNSPLIFQWYKGQKEDTSSPVGTNSSTYLTPALLGNAHYWVRVSNSFGSADSDTITVGVIGFTVNDTLMTDWKDRYPDRYFGWTVKSGSIIRVKLFLSYNSVPDGYNLICNHPPEQVVWADDRTNVSWDLHVPIVTSTQLRYVEVQVNQTLGRFYLEVIP